MKKKLIRDCTLLACGCALALLAMACETSDKQVHAKPAPQAQAPTINAQIKPTAKPSAVAVVARAQVPDPPSQADQVDKLVAQAEKQYQQGQKEYAAGHLEGAKRIFDQAANIPLEGRGELRSDKGPRRDPTRSREGVNRPKVAAHNKANALPSRRPSRHPSTKPMTSLSRSIPM